MNMTEVVELCRELHVKGEPGPYGVAFSWHFDAFPDREGFETYARWHTFGMTGSVQWFQRQKRRVA
jgi:hypothetical protein